MLLTSTFQMACRLSVIITIQLSTLFGVGYCVGTANIRRHYVKRIFVTALRTLVHTLLFHVHIEPEFLTGNAASHHYLGA